MSLVDGLLGENSVGQTQFVQSLDNKFEVLRRTPNKNSLRQLSKIRSYKVPKPKETGSYA